MHNTFIENLKKIYNCDTYIMSSLLILLSCIVFFKLPCDMKKGIWNLLPLEEDKVSMS